MSAFHLLRPEWLLLLLAAPLPLLLERAHQRAAGGWHGVVAPHLLSAMLVAEGHPARLRPAFCATGLLILLAVALAGPAWRREPSPFVADRAPMVAGVDLSRASAPTLAAAKRKLRDLIALRAGARTGLVAYAGDAHMALPPTDDPDLFTAYLDALAPGVMPRDGQNAGAAAALARSMLDREGGAGTFVLLSPVVPAIAAAEFGRAWSGSQHAIIVLATGAGPFDGAPGAAVVGATPDGSDVADVAGRAQRHFEAAPADDPTMRWRDEGWWLAVLALPLVLLWARRGFLAGVVLAVALPLGPHPAAAADWQWFWRLWLTPDQEARLLLERGRAAEAAALFSDPVWRGIALYRAGDYDGAVAAFALVSTAIAQYDAGNAQMMRPRAYEEAIAAYDRALASRPGFTEAADNRAIAAAFLAQQRAAEAGRVANQDDDPFDRPPPPQDVVADQHDQQPQQPPDPAQAGDGLSDGDIQAMWMRRVGGTPADFLRLRFAREAEAPR